MKLITRDTDYAIRALSSMAGCKEKTVSVKELVKRLKIPRPFLRKILQKLNKKGFLKSHKGKGGGFTLALKADKIFVLDLIRVFQGPLELTEHLFKGRLCPNTKCCVFKKKMDAIERHVASELSDVTISYLAGKGKKHK